MESPVSDSELNQVFLQQEPRFTDLLELQNRLNHTDSQRRNVTRLLAHILDLYDNNEQDYCTHRVSLISLMDMLLHDHGRELLLWIPEIIGVVLKVLSSDFSTSSKEICTNVVRSLVECVSDQTDSSDNRTDVVLRSVSYPLVDSLLGKGEQLSVASATCFQTMIESETWELAPKDLVNQLCFRVADAIYEKRNQTICHMNLISSLAERNGSSLEPYGSSLLVSAEEILEDSAMDDDDDESEKAKCVVKMINSLLENTDIDFLLYKGLIVNLKKRFLDRNHSFQVLAEKTFQIAKIRASLQNQNLTDFPTSDDEEEPEQTAWLGSPQAMYCKNFEDGNGMQERWNSNESLDPLLLGITGLPISDKEENGGNLSRLKEFRQIIVGGIVAGFLAFYVAMVMLNSLGGFGDYWEFFHPT